MSKGTHTIGAKWREADATALEERVTAISEWLDHTEDLIAMLGDDEKTVTELRSMAGVLRTQRNDFSQKSAGLRAELADQNGRRG